MVLRLSWDKVVVITGNVKVREHGFCIWRSGGAWKRQRKRSRSVERSHLIGQLFADLPAAFDLQLGNLVADSPDHNGWMVTIAQHHRRDIPLPPFVKVPAVVELDLVCLPGIERL